MFLSYRLIQSSINFLTLYRLVLKSEAIVQKSTGLEFTAVVIGITPISCTVNSVQPIFLGIKKPQQQGTLLRLFLEGVFVVYTGPTIPQKLEGYHFFTHILNHRSSSKLNSRPFLSWL